MTKRMVNTSRTSKWNLKRREKWRCLFWKTTLEGRGTQFWMETARLNHWLEISTESCVSNSPTTKEEPYSGLTTTRFQWICTRWITPIRTIIYMAKLWFFLSLQEGAWYKRKWSTRGLIQNWSLWSLPSFLTPLQVSQIILYSISQRNVKGIYI